MPRRQGRLYVFGVPHHETQEFPWFHTVCNETEIITSMGPECKEYFQTAVDMIVQGRTDLVDMVTPRMPWEKAAEALPLYERALAILENLCLNNGSSPVRRQNIVAAHEGIGICLQVLGR